MMPPTILTAMLIYLLGLVVPMYLLLGRVDGWGTLARAYGWQEPILHQRRWFVSGAVGSFTYRWGLCVAVHPTGLFLVPLGMRRIGHPPLCIPWTNVTAVYQSHDRGALRRLQVRTPTAPVAVVLPASVLAPVHAQLPAPQPGTTTVTMSRGAIGVTMGFGGLSLLYFWFLVSTGIFP